MNANYKILNRLILFFVACFMMTATSNTQTLVLDFEVPSTSDEFTGCGGGFGNVFPQGIVADPDPANPSNNALKMIKVNPSEVWGGICNLNDLNIDFTTDNELCFDFYEEDAAGGTLRIKLEESVKDIATTWVTDFTTSQGWNTYCVNTNIPTATDDPDVMTGTTAAGNVYQRIVVFPDFGTCCTDQCYYFDNLYVNPITCPLALSATSAICGANTTGMDTYTATFSFSQATAPGSLVYTITPSAGTLSLISSDPNFSTSGDIVITGIPEGTNITLDITDGAMCNLSETIISPTCEPPVSITFNVDMNCPDPTDAFTTVHITGPFCDWCGGGFDLMDSDGDGIWTGTFDFPANSNLEFKYIVDGFGSQEELVDDALALNGTPSNCAPITNFFDYANRELIIGTSPITTNDTYGSCFPCGTVLGCTDPNSITYNPSATMDDGSCLYEVSFSVDLNCADHIVEDAAAFTDPPTVVTITGPLFGWHGSGNGTDLDDSDGDGIWTGSLQLPAGPFTFTYMINNWAAKENLIDDAGAGGTCVGESGADFANRIYTITTTNMDMFMDTYGSCSACPSACPPSLSLTGTNTGDGSDADNVADNETDGNLSSDQTIAGTATVDYDSATDIDLLPGFETVIGAVFCAFIDGCGGASADDENTNTLQESNEENTSNKK